MERVRCARAMSRWIGQWLDDLQLLDDRAGPSVQDDERQRIFMLRADVDEVNVQPIDLGDEVRQSLQFRLALAPVVLVVPVARERLHRRQLHALRGILDGLLLGPARRRDARPQVLELRLRDADVEGADGGVLGRCAWRCGTWAGRGALRHCRFLSSVQGTTRRATRRPSRTSSRFAVSTRRMRPAKCRWRRPAFASDYWTVRVDSPSGQSWPRSGPTGRG